MSTDPLRLVKAVGALVVLGVLLVLVSGFWGQYRSGRAQPQAESTATIEATSSAEATDAPKGSEAVPASPKSQTKTVIIKIDGLNFREEAKPDGKPIRGLKKGDKLILVEEQGSWYLVKDDDGTQGYISSNPNYTSVEE